MFWKLIKKTKILRIYPKLEMIHYEFALINGSSNALVDLVLNEKIQKNQMRISERENKF